jgi:hypothetical protein
MLSKLLKHEFKATARLLLPLYLVLFVLTIVERVAMSLNLKGSLEIIPGFSTMAYILSIVAIAVVSCVIIILRFYKNLMTDEGYLMFTLPVKPQQLINAKLLVSIVWTIASVVFITISLFGAFITKERFDLLIDGIGVVFTEMKHEFGTINMNLLIVEFILLMILGIINNILIIYASIAVGQLFNGHKILGSFAAYIGISTVLQIIVTASFVILGIIFNKSFEEINSLPQIIFPLTIVYILITNILFYFGTDFLFKKKLNLE